MVLREDLLCAESECRHRHKQRPLDPLLRLELLDSELTQHCGDRTAWSAAAFVRLRCSRPDESLGYGRRLRNAYENILWHLRGCTLRQ
jgi:hypothetical protein